MKLSQMQALKSQKGGFTLVELIVVITILAILATVGFLSFQNYTKDAKSATVRENIGQLSSAMNVAGTKGSMLDLITSSGGVTRTIDASHTIFGSTGGLAYVAGDVNFAKVPGIDSSKMMDARSVNPRLPLVGFASNADNSALQIASTIKEGELDVVYVIGNYSSGTGTDLDGLIGDRGTTTSLVDKTQNHSHRD